MNAEVLGRLVVQRRKHLRLDQKALAELAQVSVHALSNLETGKGNPTLGLVGKVIDVLGLELELKLRQSGSEDDS